MTIHPEHALSPKGGHGSVLRISWGLVQIPIRIHLITDAGSSVPARNMFTVDGHPIGKRNYDKNTGLDYDGDIIKKVAMGGDAFVELTDEEIAANSTLTKGIAEIETFIPLSALGTLYITEKPGVWSPDTMTVGKKKIVDPSAAKACALLRKAMAAQEVAALVLVPSSSGGKFVALLPDGMAATLSFADQVRVVEDPVADIEVSDAEMALATQLIAGLGISSPVLTDTAGDLLRTYLDAKAAGTTPVAIAEVTAPVQVDLMAALTASVAAAKAAKPAAAKKSKKVAA